MDGLIVTLDQTTRPRRKVNTMSHDLGPHILSLHPSIHTRVVHKPSRPHSHSQRSTAKGVGRGPAKSRGYTFPPSALADGLWPIGGLWTYALGTATGARAFRGRKTHACMHTYDQPTTATRGISYRPALATPAHLLGRIKHPLLGREQDSSSQHALQQLARHAPVQARRSARRRSRRCNQNQQSSPSTPVRRLFVPFPLDDRCQIPLTPPS